MKLNLEISDDDQLDNLPDDGSAPPLETLLNLLRGFDNRDWLCLTHSDGNSEPWFQLMRESRAGYRVEFFDPATGQIYATTPVLVPLAEAEACLRAFVTFGADSASFRATAKWVKGEHQPRPTA